MKSKHKQVVTKLCLMTFAALVLAMGFPGSVWGLAYTATMISSGTDNLNAYAPHVNNLGHVVWFGPDGSTTNDREIFFYDGTTVHQITNNNYDDQYPDLNDNDDIVWVGKKTASEWHIYMAHGVSIPTQVSTSPVSSGSAPHLNNSGAVVWHGTPSGQYDIDIFLYTGGTPQVISNNTYMDYTPDINDAGKVVWTTKVADNDYKLYLYDDGSLTDIHSSTYPANAPRINNLDEVVWYQTDYNDEIFLRQSSGTDIISIHSTEDWRPALNDSTMVVWEGGPQLYHNIYLYLGGEVSAISPFSDARYPDINNNGWVAYQAFNGTSTEIYLAQPFCAAQFTTADNSEYLVVGLIYPGEVHYLGFAASNFSQPVFTGKSQVTGQGQDQNGPWETYVYGYSFSGGPMYVGGGYSSANSGWYYGVNLQNQQVSFNGAYVKNPSGNYYDYFHAFSTGAVYLGASYAGTAAGYFYGLPATAPQTHYLGALVQAQSFNDYNLMCSPYWSLTHCLTVLDETY